ncbi:MAG: DUF2336 domain-containing protein [Xanthobacteraceae bacterium]|nr:DUF2336 domain-containing protein [Xanthobacteraceae bacterium]
MAQAQPSVISELERATHGDADECADALQRVTDLFLSGADRFSEDQVRLFEDVLGFLIERIDTRARAELSTRLALVERAPIRVIRRLAIDDELIVAEPVLTNSPRLSAEELMQIARAKSQGHLLAISGRRQLDQSVTDILLDRGNREVIYKLAQNAGARFSESGHTTLVVKAQSDDQLAVAVGLRLDVPQHLFERLLLQASKTVRSRLLSQAPPETRREIERVLAFVSREIGWEVTAPRDFARAQAIVREKHRQGELDEAALAEFARTHKYEELVAALALLSMAPLEVIDALMGSPRNDGLLVPCRVAALGWSTVDAILSNRGAHHALTPHDRKKLSEDYKRLSRETARQVLGFWQARAAEPRQRH